VLVVVGLVALGKTIVYCLTLWSRSVIAHLPVAAESDLDVLAPGPYRVQLECSRFAFFPRRRAFGTGRPRMSLRELSTGEEMAVTPPAFPQTFWGFTRARHLVGSVRVARAGAYRLTCADRGDAPETLARDGFQLVVCWPYYLKFALSILLINVSAWILAGGVMLIVYAGGLFAR
jgi:hypothetical protein